MKTASLKLLALCGLLFSLVAPASAYVVGPTTPGKWGPPAVGTGATVSWSLMPTGTSCSAIEGGGCSITAFGDLLPSGWMNAVNTAFDMWSSVADLHFVQVADDGAAEGFATNSGDIRLGLHAFDGSFGVLAHGYYPPANGGSAAGDIHLDSAELWKIGFGGPGIDITQVLAHELGHALGLDHSSTPNSLMNPFYSEAFFGPQADDIAGIQYLYGAPLVAVPEPGMLWLVGIGMGALLLGRR
ncbi:MAG TPA: matrixin family metalloprotease, partial [Rhodocyclaceae bacterium]|nr:matrixin family metalloprotease [Rhodocyclaceae bacterium]